MTSVMSIVRALRSAPGTLVVAWLGVLAAFIGLAVWAGNDHFVPGEQRTITYLWGHHFWFWESPNFWNRMSNVGDPRYLLAVAAVVVLTLLLRGHRVEAILLAAAIPASLVVIPIRHVVYRAVDRAALPHYISYPSTNSFPSGHVVGEMLVYGLLFLFAAKIVPWRAGAAMLRAVCVFLIAFGALERMVDALHWPTDIGGSALLASMYLMPAAWVSAEASREIELRDRPLAEPVPDLTPVRNTATGDAGG